ncbi:MAG TPA: ABC transporter ATP-binding protein [Patescibacteria group bacterium]|nr:ABC transporter ATP-binding protein [Patescibacteria group bacterium]
MDKLKKRTQNILTLENILVKRGDFKLTIKQLSLHKKEIACVVGPNGSGKTSLLLTVLGLLPHEGLCKVNGHLYDGSQVKIKSSIGFIPDDPELLFEELTAQEQWSVTASVLSQIKGTSEAELKRHTTELAQSVSFNPPENKLARDYSHGMRKKTQVVNALIASPPVVVIDELRNGLDPMAITQAETLIKKERDSGAAVLAATHDLWWAERFADYIYIILDGGIAAEGTVKQLLRPKERSLEEAFYRIVGAKK